MYEIQPLLERSSYKHRESWEQTRLLMYVIAQGNSTKKLAPSDLLKFPWDEENEDKPKAPTDEDISSLRNKIQEFIKNKNNASGFSNTDTIEERPV